MAVAADSHRNFLIPEYAVLQHTRQPARNVARMICLYSFAKSIISQKNVDCNRKNEFLEKIPH